MDLGIDLGGTPLESKGRSNGTSYTPVELRLAQQCALLVLVATKHVDGKDIKFDKEVTDNAKEAFESVTKNGGKASVPSLTRALYRHIEKQKLSDPKTKEDFPRMKDGQRDGRDHTSIGLLVRKGLKEAGIDQDMIDKAFPSNYSTKNKTG